MGRVTVLRISLSKSEGKQSWEGKLAWRGGTSSVAECGSVEKLLGVIVDSGKQSGKATRQESSSSTIRACEVLSRFIG